MSRYPRHTGSGSSQIGDPDHPPAQSAVIGARGATGVGLASLIAAGSGYLVLLIAARTLDPARNAEFLTFWGLLFFVFGILGGLQNETTRAVHVARTTNESESVAHRPASTANGVRALPAGLAIGAVLALVFVASGAWWGQRVLGAHPGPLILVVAVATLAFSGHSALAGALAGSGRWSTYARLVGAESTMRLALVVGMASLGARVFGLSAASATAAGTWLVIMVLSADARSAAVTRTGDTARPFLSRTAQAMLATAASAAIVVGFPVLLRVSTAPDLFERAAPLLLAVQMTRAPLMIPLTTYQGVAITYFLTHKDRGAAPLLRLGAIVLTVGAIGAALAALLGPWLMVTIFGPSYVVARATLGALTLAAAFLGILTLTGAAVLATGRHASYAAGWVTATVITVGLLLVPAPIEARTVLALSAGPAIGVLVHLVAIHRHKAPPG